MTPPEVPHGAAADLPAADGPPAALMPDELQPNTLQPDVLPLAALQQSLQALQAQGAPTLDPVGFHLLQGLARRAARLQGPAQAWVQQRLSLHLARCQARVAEAGRPPGEPVSRTHRSGPGQLAGVLQRLAADKGGAEAAAEPRAEAAASGLRAVQRFQGTWQRLHADQQIRRSLAKQPEGSGPLNSHRLVLQALQTLQALSPAYLERFVGQLEAWAWLSQLQQAALAPPPASASAPQAERKRRRA